MKSTLPLLALFALTGAAHAQSFTESFDDLGGGSDAGNISTLTARGWAETNNSNSPSGYGPYFQGQTTEFAPHTGAGYVATNYRVGGDTLSAWLISPAATLSNGSTFSFWTRTATPGATVFPDRLEVRLSTNGASTDVGSTTTSTGDFTTLLTTINPNLTATDYPTEWTQYTATVSGLTSSVTGRFAFRYNVTGSGLNGTNGNTIGIDDVTYSYNAVPEPTSLAFLGLGALGLLRRRRK